jgi:hypothetical protein
VRRFSLASWCFAGVVSMAGLAAAQTPPPAVPLAPPLRAPLRSAAFFERALAFSSSNF